MSVENVFLVILCFLGSILLIALTILSLRLMKTLKKVDDAIDDYNEKSRKLNGVFDLIDVTTDTISSLGDKLVSSLINGISSLFKRKKKEETEDE